GTGGAPFGVGGFQRAAINNQSFTPLSEFETEQAGMAGFAIQARRRFSGIGNQNAASRRHAFITRVGEAAQNAAASFGLGDDGINQQGGFFASALEQSQPAIAVSVEFKGRDHDGNRRTQRIGNFKAGGFENGA